MSDEIGNSPVMSVAKIVRTKYILMLYVAYHAYQIYSTSTLEDYKNMYRTLTKNASITENLITFAIPFGFLFIGIFIMQVTFKRWNDKERTKQEQYNKIKDILEEFQTPEEAAAELERLKDKVSELNQMGEKSASSSNKTAKNDSKQPRKRK